MRRCVCWLPTFALVACLPVLAADDEPKKPDAGNTKGEVKKSDSPVRAKDKQPVPATKAGSSPSAKKYVEGPTVYGRVKRIDSNKSELHVEVGYGRFAKVEELTLAEDVQYLTRIHPETVDDNGKVKKIVGPELQKLRVPKFKDRFASNANEIQKGQVVEVVLGRVKESGPKRPAAKSKGGEKDVLVVVRVTIMSDDRAATGRGGRGEPKGPPKKDR